ncbi:hypothetical protein K438DRAFT_1173681 [Mycena galopus ATCC 62051]|nr:hypothetical protein K438DRAFT_1173681 [Mycena galopus ATCC 62051]
MLRGPRRARQSGRHRLAGLMLLLTAQRSGGHAAHVNRVAIGLRAWFYSSPPNASVGNNFSNPSLPTHQAHTHIPCTADVLYFALWMLNYPLCDMHVAQHPCTRAAIRVSFSFESPFKQEFQ